MIDRSINVPVYIQLADDIRSMITSGKIKPGEKLMSENEMMREYGVARLTVREALSVLVNEGLIEKKHGKGTFCKNTVKGLSIDVLLDMSDYYFIPYYIRSISSVFDKSGADFIVGDTKNSWEEIVKLLNKILQKGSDGVIVQASPEKDFDKNLVESLFRQFEEKQIPLIQIDTDYGIDGQSYVIMDEEKIGIYAGECFLRYGHKKTAILYMPNNRISDMRMKYFKAKFENVTEIEFNNEMKNNIKAAYESGVTGIFCFSDYVAKECVDALTELKLSVPDDVSLISVDDTLISKVYKLTSITHAKEKIGEIAAKSIIERNLPVMKIFSPDISERDSVKRIK